MNKIIVITVIIIILSAGLFLLFNGKIQSSKTSPVAKVASKNVVRATPTPTPFKIDYKMNLGEELENVEPQVLDEDFSDLESQIKTF